MNWLWDKVRHSFRDGKLRTRIRKFLQVPNSDHLVQSPNEECSAPLEDDDEDLISYFGICPACKLTISHYRNFNFSALDLLPTRSNECAFCEFAERERTEEDNVDTVYDTQFLDDSHADTKRSEFRRDRRTGSEPAIPRYRLPPINDCVGGVTNCVEESNSHGRLDNLDVLLSFDNRITLFLPPIVSTNNELDRVRNVESASRSSSVIIARKFDSTSEGCKKIINSYGVIPKTRYEFLKELRKARQTEDFTNLHYFFGKTFNSFGRLCAVFKVDPMEEGASLDDSGLELEFVYSVHDAIAKLPSVLQKSILKSIINSLLEESKVVCDKDKIRAVFILLQCPIFIPQSSYIVFAHLLRYCINLPSSHHQLLVGWFKILDVNRLRAVIRQLLQFMTVRQFSTGDKFLPPLSKSRWWIPTATKLLALINAANNECSPPLINYTELYNFALDHIDLMQDYYVWQNCRHPTQFAYCQYPFVLSILAKRFILTKDSEQQMILNARKSLVAKMTRHQTPQIDIFFLNINVRRSHLVSDSLNEITCKQRDLKKKLKVSFVGEPGLDMGGLTKEWFLLLVRKIFDSNYGMFVYHPNSHCYWFSIDNVNGNLREYNLIGVLMGLAMYNSNILDLHFPSVCYRKLLTPPVVPTVDDDENDNYKYSNMGNRIGVIESPTLEDLNEIMPDIARGLKELLEYDGDVEEDMGMNFQISVEEFGVVKTFQLTPNGEEIPVTNENREEYVNCYLNWILNVAIYKQFKAFYLGFHSVCASNALIMLRGEEVEMLVCGSQTLNLSELRKITEYDGFDPEEECIRNFWEIVETLPDNLKRKFLLFTTGSDRISVGGISEMTFKITRLPHKVDNLPEAHTCFNQLVLPRYENKTILREKLITAISNSEGFGLE